MSLKAKIEAVIYAADEPVTPAQLAAIFADEVLALATDALLPLAGDTYDAAAMDAATDAAEEPALPAEDADAKKQARARDRAARGAVQKIVDELIAEYATGDRGMEIREIAGGYRIATKTEYHDAVRLFVKGQKPQLKLSLQALETLAVVAYKQPVTAPEISEIRGVDTSGVLGGLMAHKLITTAGRKQVIGRPILYKTTREFLLRFGLKDVSELPSMEEFEKMAADMASDMGDLEDVATGNSSDSLDQSEVDVTAPETSFSQSDSDRTL
jgi:segregation and condensation protein B